MAITITLLQLKSKYYFNTTGFNASEKHGLEQKNMWRDRVARLHLTMEGISAQKKKIKIVVHVFNKSTYNRLPRMINGSSISFTLIRS